MESIIEISEQRYNSTNGFVGVNNLDKQANECFGKDWEAEDDVNQIQELLKFVGRYDLVVSFIEGLKEDDILVSKFIYTNKRVTYDDTRDISIRVIKNLIEQGLLSDDDDTYFQLQDTIHDEINEVLGLDIDDNFEVGIIKSLSRYGN